MYKKRKENSMIYLFKDSYTNGKYGLESSRNQAAILNRKIDADYCIFSVHDSGEIVTDPQRGTRKKIYPRIAFVVTKIVSFTPARVDKAFLSKPVFVPPQVVVQDQGGTQFNLLEAHRIHYGDGTHGIHLDSAVNGTPADATLITPVDRVFKLTAANRLPTPYINKSRLNRKCDLFFMTKENAANRLQDWKQNKNMYIEQVKMLYDQRQKYRQKQRQSKSRQQKRIDDLDSLFE